MTAKDEAKLTTIIVVIFNLVRLQNKFNTEKSTQTPATVQQCVQKEIYCHATPEKQQQQSKCKNKAHCNRIILN